MEKPHFREYKAMKDFPARQIAPGAYEAGYDPHEFPDDSTGELLPEKREGVKAGEVLLADPIASKGEYEGLPFVVFRLRDRLPNSTFSMHPEAFTEYTELAD